MKPYQIGVIVFSTILTFSALYAPQPLQPLLMEEFGVSQERSALLTTVTMLPLGLAPIVYGYMLESFSSRRLLRFALLALAVLQFLFFLSPSFNVLIILRFFVGLAIPAVLTSLMTYISNMSEKGNVQRLMAFYISSTIMGGFAGRFFSGLIAATLGWRMNFLSLSIALLLSFFLTASLHEAELKVSKFSPAAVIEVIKRRRFGAVYLLIFATFFMFAALLNFLPFRMRELNEASSSLTIGVMYTGYIMGIVMSLNSLRIVRFLGGEMRTVFTALSFYCLTLFFFTFDSVAVMFAGMFFFCCCMFLAHSVASGYLNKIAEDRKGITNGLYVSFYYIGGTLGSILPGFVYSGFGWKVFLLSIGLVMASAVVIGRITLGRLYYNDL
ncbi:MFS transporter [Limisalsivibrio acetivorans]|uniref:MFS transporter n=1 Tax=Limisalsivibrio acetivorans TaxID=1304888 RepID=UPI0003B658DB|nr:MFS transporter [Limisalsivibrio acetivorans]